MQVPVWITADFVCPWCWIGEKRLFDAIALLPNGIEVTVHWLPFELNPEFPPEGMARFDYRVEKFGSWERSLAADAKVVAVGQEEGLSLNYDRVERTPNTFLAHRLVHWAQGAGHPVRPLAEALFRAYFAEGRDIGQSDVLLVLAADAGLETAAAAEALASKERAGEVRALEWEMTRRGIHGVPFFNIWGVGASGAVPAASLKQVFDMAIARRERSPGQVETG